MGEENRGSGSFLMPGGFEFQFVSGVYRTRPRLRRSRIRENSETGRQFDPKSHDFGYNEMSSGGDLLLSSRSDGWDQRTPPDHSGAVCTGRGAPPTERRANS